MYRPLPVYRPLLAAALLLVIAACSDGTVVPTNPLETAPTLQFSHLGGDPGADDLCGGLSPCDAFDYDRDGDGDPDGGPLGAPGFCFSPPTVDNHGSDPACSGDLAADLDGVFQLTWCRVEYPLGGDGLPDGTVPPTIVECSDERLDLVRGGDFYSASVQWKRNGARAAEVGDIFRLYVVRGDVHYAHRDVVIDPNDTRPADDFLHSIGYGTEPVKVRITEDFRCVYFDTQGGRDNNAATCLITGATSLSFVTDEVTTTFTFREGNEPFAADFEVSECLSLGFFAAAAGPATGNALVDVPLADCKISVSSEEIEALTVPGQITISISDPRWDETSVTAPFRNARINVLQSDEAGVAALPPSEPPSPNWFGEATREVALLRWIGKGLDRLASWLGPEPVYAALRRSFDWSRMSDFQVAVMPIMTHDAAHTATGGPCATDLASCLHLGTFAGPNPVPVHVKVTAPPRDPGLDPSDFEVPDTRLHFFPDGGSVACPSPAVSGQQCYAAGADDNSTDNGDTPPSHWDHLVVITDSDGLATVAWTLDPGPNRLDVSGCGVARAGTNEPNPPGEPGTDHVWGTLGDCSDRSAALTATGAYDNGPADGHTPFEPVDVTNEVAIFGLPLTFEAMGACPDIFIDGYKGDDGGGEHPGPEWVCADTVAFIAPLKGGPKTQSPNAWLYTYNDEDALYIGLEVVHDELGNKIFVNLVETLDNGNLIAADGDDLLVNDFVSDTYDWHFTQACVDNSSSSLCGEPDSGLDGGSLDVEAGAQLSGAGAGHVFYEFKRPFGANADEDLEASAPLDRIGLRLRVTQGEGGGKGGFVYPDPQQSTTKEVYYEFQLR